MQTAQTQRTNEPPRHGDDSPFTAIGLIDIPLLWQRRWHLVASTVFFVAVGGIYIWKADPMHRVSARVLVEKQGVSLDQRPGLDRDKDFLPTQAEIIRSPAVIRRVVETLALPEDTSDEATAIVSILQRLSVDPLIGTNVLSVRFLDEQPERGVVTVDAILAAYREYLQDNERQAHRETLDLLTRREQELRDDLKSLHARYQQLHQESPLVGQGRDAAEVQKALLADLGKTLTATRSRRLELENHAQALIADESHAVTVDRPEGIWLTHATPVALPSPKTPTAASETKDTATTAALPLNDGWKRTLDVLAGMSKEGWIGVEDPTPLLQAYLEARARETELNTLYGPRHPQIRAIRPQLAELELRLQEVIETAPATLERQRQAILSQERALVDMYEQEYEQAKTADHYALEELQIQEELANVQTLHEAILAEIKQWQLVDQAAAEGRLGVLVRVLEEPAVTQQPLSASPSLVLGLCGVFGLLGGVFLVAATERLK